MDLPTDNGSVGTRQSCLRIRWRLLAQSIERYVGCFLYKWPIDWELMAGRYREEGGDHDHDSAVTLGTY